MVTTFNTTDFLIAYFFHISTCVHTQIELCHFVRHLESGDLQMLVEFIKCVCMCKNYKHKDSVLYSLLTKICIHFSSLHV